jgi:hypothetical protein
MKSLINFLIRFKAGWDMAKRAQAPSKMMQPKPLRVKVGRFYKAGENNAVLWHVITVKENDGKEKTHREQWVMNHVTRHMDWAPSLLGEWDDDKAKGEPQEIKMMVADVEFPGSVRALVRRNALRGKQRTSKG